MKKCVVCPSTQVEWNHALIYAGKQINEWYAIQPLCTSCHRGNNGTIHRKADLICKIKAIEMGLVALEIKYPKRNWAQELKQYKHELKICYGFST